MAANPQAMATSTKETEIAGPAPRRPLSPDALPPFSSKSRTGALKIDFARKCSPAAAVPVTVKMPEPITAPMPIATRLQTPRDLRSFRLGSSEAAMRSSMDLVRRSWLVILKPPVVGGRCALTLRLALRHLPYFLLHG